MILYGGRDNVGGKKRKKRGKKTIPHGVGFGVLPRWH